MPERSAVGGGRASLRLLGGWQLLVEGVEVPLKHREQRLTALLGLTGRRARAHVAGTLWPESTDARALASLRRAVLQVQQRSPGLLRVDRTDIGLAPEVEVDVDEVRRAARSTELPMPGGDAEALLAALVGEPLLPAWYDDWVLPEREHLQQLRVRALERIARHAFAMGDLVQAIDAARAALDIDPLLESARELTIRAHLGQGDRGSALREFHRHRAAMADELGVAPSSTIRALIGPVAAEGGAGPGDQAGAAGAGQTPGPSATVPEPLRLEDLHVPITPIPPAAIPPPDRARRTSAASPGPVAPAAPSEAVEPRGGRGRVVLLLLAVAVLVLVASLALAGVGPGRGDPDVTGGVLPSGSAPGPVAPDVLAGSGTGDVPTRPRQVVVRPVDAAVGSAALVVRATRRPATVRLVMRGPAGRSVVRSVVVRSQDGRRLVMDGLDPGTYRWLATSPTATPVSGRVRVDDQPPVASATPSPAAPTSVVTPVAPVTPSPDPDPTSPASPAAPPSPTQQAASVPQASPAPQPTRTPPPTREPTRQPTPSPPSPAGEPTDPGTLDPTPVG